MDKMHVYLKITPEAYEDLRLQLWLNWCESKSLTAMEWQETLVCAPYNKWFNRQVDQRERRLIKVLYKDWNRTHSKELVQRWKNEMVDLYRLFVRPIQQEIRSHTGLKDIVRDRFTGQEMILN